MLHRSHRPSKAAVPAFGLQEIYTVGFVAGGHLTVASPCHRAIQDLLREYKAAPDLVIYAVTSLANDADLVFAETCAELAIPVHIQLPLPAEKLRDTFELTQWSRVERLLSSALSIEHLIHTQHPADSFYECGVKIVQQSQMLIAVEDSQSEDELRALHEIIGFANVTHKPVYHLRAESDTLETAAHNGLRRLSRDPELQFLNRLSELGVASPDESPFSQASAWLAKLDRNALEVAPQVRRLAAFPILCTAIAAVVSGAVANRHRLSFSVAGALLGITAATLPIVLRISTRQALWVRIRTAAEVTRSVLALWDTPIRYQVIGQEVLPELEGMIHSLNALKAHARQGRSMDLERFRTRYLDERVHHQMKYFSGQVRKARSQAKLFRRISIVAAGLAILFSTYTFVESIVHKYPAVASLIHPVFPWVLATVGFVEGMAHRYTGISLGFSARPAVPTALALPILTSALFQAATVFGALLVVYDCDRRARRYQELHRTLTAFAAELNSFRTWPPVVHVVNKIERALLVELLEWRSLLQNMKMPKD